MKNETLREKFERAICTYGMLDTPSVLVGLSGGADSSVLLFLLCEYCKPTLRFATSEGGFSHLSICKLIQGIEEGFSKICFLIAVLHKL